MFRSLFHWIQVGSISILLLLLAPLMLCVSPFPLFFAAITFCNQVFIIRRTKELSIQRELTRIVCFSICNQKQNYNQKLYIIPIRTVSRFCVSSSLAGSLELGGTSPQSDSHSSTNDHRRWELVQMMLNSSFLLFFYACCILKDL